jgi:hypothetical protein
MLAARRFHQLLGEPDADGNTVGDTARILEHDR